MASTPPHTGGNPPVKEPGSAVALGVISFVVGAVFAAVWIYGVMIIGGRHDFSHAQVTGACVNVLVVTALLTYWGYRKNIDPTRTAGTVTVSLSAAVGAAFAAIAAPTDSTGLWAVGFVIIVACSLMGIGLVTVITVAVLRWILSRKH